MAGITSRTSPRCASATAGDKSLSVQTDQPCVRDGVTFDRVLKVLPPFRRRQAERGVERVEIEDVVMHAARRARAAVVVFAEAVQPLNDACRNIVLFKSG